MLQGEETWFCMQIKKGTEVGCGSRRSSRKGHASGSMQVGFGVHAWERGEDMWKWAVKGCANWALSTWVWPKKMKIIE